MKHAIICELIRAIVAMDDADADLLAIIGSYEDTLTDEEVLKALARYNSGLPVMTTLVSRSPSESR